MAGLPRRWDMTSHLLLLVPYSRKGPMVDREHPQWCHSLWLAHFCVVVRDRSTKASRHGRECELLEGCQGCSQVSHICPEKQERFLHKGKLLNRRSCCLLLLSLTQLTEASLMLAWVTVLLGWDCQKQIWWRLHHSAKASHTGFKGFFFAMWRVIPCLLAAFYFGLPCLSFQIAYLNTFSSWERFHRVRGRILGKGWRSKEN